MTFLAQAHPWLSEAERLRNRALFVGASAAVASEINRAMEEVLSYNYPGWLAQLAHYLHDHRCKVITLNYDTLLERALQTIEFGQDPTGKPGGLLDPRALYPISFADPAVRGRMPPTATILKLHGSTSWFYSGRSEYFGEPLRSQPLRGWTPDDLMIREPELSGRVPLIVPPVAEKWVTSKTKLFSTCGGKPAFC